MWLFGYGRGLKMAKIKDGTSNTALISEVRVFDPTNAEEYSEDIRGAWTSASMGASTYSHYTTPNSETPDAINGCGSDGNGGMLLCELIWPSGDRAGDTYAAARSEHLGGVVLAKADGSVQFYSDTVSPKVWSQLATRDEQSQGE